MSNRERARHAMRQLLSDHPGLLPDANDRRQPELFDDSCSADHPRSDKSDPKRERAIAAMRATFAYQGLYTADELARAEKIKRDWLGYACVPVETIAQMLRKETDIG